MNRDDADRQYERDSREPTAMKFIVKDGMGEYYAPDTLHGLSKKQRKAIRYATREEAERVASQITGGHVVRLRPRQ